jgi:hypothetical protein
MVAPEVAVAVAGLMVAMVVLAVVVVVGHKLAVSVVLAEAEAAVTQKEAVMVV